MKRMILITVLSAAFITTAYGLASAHGEKDYGSAGSGHMGSGFDHMGGGFDHMGGGFGHMGGGFGQMLHNLGQMMGFSSGSPGDGDYPAGFQNRERTSTSPTPGFRGNR